LRYFRAEIAIAPGPGIEIAISPTERAEIAIQSIQEIGLWA